MLKIAYVRNGCVYCFVSVCDLTQLSTVTFPVYVNY